MSNARRGEHGVLLEALSSQIKEASEAFSYAVDGNGAEWHTLDNAAWWIEASLHSILGAFESLGLSLLAERVRDDLRRAQESKDGFASSAPGYEEPYAIWLSRSRQYLLTLNALLGVETKPNVSKELLGILRNAQYSITDEAAFGHIPRNELDVHLRLESIMKCVYPDLRTKPPIAKPVKNFQPDTGIPHLRTLIEYKFVSRKADTSRVADEILADVSGYRSRDWDSFIYVVYETRRLRPEREWNDLLRESSIDERVRVVVLSGEPAGKDRPTIMPLQLTKSPRTAALRRTASVRRGRS